jgi:hypothetical protein
MEACRRLHAHVADLWFRDPATNRLRTRSCSPDRQVRFQLSHARTLGSTRAVTDPVTGGQSKRPLLGQKGPLTSGFS